MRYNRSKSGRKVIVRLSGGLGNQLFQYAAGYRLAQVNGVDLVVDNVTGFAEDLIYHRKYALSPFNIAGRVATPRERMEPFGQPRRYIARRSLKKKPHQGRWYLVQENPGFCHWLLHYEVKGTVYLEGYWQSEKYFRDVRDGLRLEYELVPPQDPTSLQIARQIALSDSVCVHVRWFDHPHVSESTYQLMRRYYHAAITEMQRRVPSARFFLFSDNLGMAKVMIVDDEPKIILVEHRSAESAVVDLWLMSKCNYHIIADSTFSWWGAWLANNATPGTVIAPSRKLSQSSYWGFEGLLPGNWQRIHINER